MYEKGQRVPRNEENPEVKKKKAENQNTVPGNKQPDRLDSLQYKLVFNNEDGNNMLLMMLPKDMN